MKSIPMSELVLIRIEILVNKSCAYVKRSRNRNFKTQSVYYFLSWDPLVAAYVNTNILVMLYIVVVGPLFHVNADT